MGTNHLVSDDAKVAAKQMEDRIVEGKSQAENVAVSSVLKRYDNTVPQFRITDYNNLVHELCTKHNITFIDNGNIDQSMLNRSNLHLNYSGDKTLGKTLCSYLRSIRSGNQNYDNSNFFSTRQAAIESPKGLENTCCENDTIVVNSLLDNQTKMSRDFLIKLLSSQSARIQNGFFKYSKLAKVI